MQAFKSGLAWVLDPIKQEAIDDKKKKDAENNKKLHSALGLKAGQYKFESMNSITPNELKQNKQINYPNALADDATLAPTNQSTPTSNMHDNNNKTFSNFPTAPTGSMYDLEAQKPLIHSHAAPQQLIININDFSKQAASAMGDAEESPDAESSEKIQKKLREGDLVQLSKSFARNLFGEFFGTGLLTFLIVGLYIELGLKHITDVGAAFGSGLVVMFLVYALGEVSGAHLNPIVSYAFALRGHFSSKFVLFYWLAQFLGSLVGAGMLAGFYGFSESSLGSNQPQNGRSLVACMLFEAVVSCGFILVALNVATAGKQLGRHSALAVGAAIGVGLMLLTPFTSASMNPMRSIGPALVSGPSDVLWPYVIGPFIGATVAVIATRIMMPSKSDPVPSS